jgi:hypothetical protein
VLAPVSAEDQASVQGIVELRATITKLERLASPTPRLLALLTRWAPQRIISEMIEETLIGLDLSPLARIPAHTRQTRRRSRLVDPNARNRNRTRRATARAT